MPENLQGSERYDKADGACTSLSDAVDSLDDMISAIGALDFDFDDVTTSLEEAME